MTEEVLVAPAPPTDPTGSDPKKVLQRRASGTNLRAMNVLALLRKSSRPPP